MTKPTHPSGQAASVQLMPLRTRHLDSRVLLTNDAGEYAWLSEEAYRSLTEGSLSADDPQLIPLQKAHLIESPGGESAIMNKLRRRSAYLWQGPSLHILILTLRCDQACVYCHASRRSDKARGVDMSEDTANRALDVIFQSPSPDLTIEFQGGEPSLHFDLLRHVVEEAYRRADQQQRKVRFSLVSNLGQLKQDQMDFLVEAGVLVCTSLDGPADLHDANRPWKMGSSHAATLAKMKAFESAYQTRGLDPELATINALVTVSRASLAQPEAIIDQYVDLGHKVLHLRPLNPFGMGARVFAQHGYDAEAFLDFYGRAFAHLLTLNRQGVEIMEKTASLFLTRILTDRDPNYMDLRSPCGAGIGQMAYHFDGRVYTCDEGRMLGTMGDDMFCMGNVHEHDYAQLIRHKAVRSACVSSCLECLPGCSDCAYAPYCGVCPVYNYATEGDLVARSPSNDRCKIQMGILDMLFLALEDKETLDLLSRWTLERDRSSVYQRLGSLTVSKPTS